MSDIASKIQSLPGVPWALKRLAAKKPEILGALLTGAAFGGAGYVGSKRWKKDQPSIEERRAKKGADVAEASARSTLARGGKLSYPQRMHRMYTKAHTEMADIMKDHPVAAAASFAGLGASMGPSVARGLMNITQSIKNGSLR